MIIVLQPLHFSPSTAIILYRQYVTCIMFSVEYSKFQIKIMFNCNAYKVLILLTHWYKIELMQKIDKLKRLAEERDAWRKMTH